MSEYYYNEKKGRYEPVSEAPLGIKPKEKSNKGVFTAENYSKENDESFSSHYADETDDTRFRKITNPVESVVNSLADAISQAAENNTQSRSNTSSSGSYYSGRNSGYNGNKNTTAQKNKVGLSLFIAIIWGVFIAIRSCSN